MDSMMQELADDLVARMTKVVAKAHARPASPWLDCDAAAAYLGLSVANLNTMRVQKRGPRYSRPTFKVLRYHVSALNDYIQKGDGTFPQPDEAVATLAPLRNGGAEEGGAA